MSIKKKQKKEKHYKPESHSEKNESKQHVLTVIRELGKDATLKTLFPKLENKLTQEEIIIGLTELEKRGKIRIEQKGIIKLLENREPKQREKPVNESRGGKFFFGKADVTQSGAAFVTVEGLAKDVYIPKSQVRNAMDGDQVKIRITSHTRRPEGEIISIVKRAQDSFTGRIDVLDKFAFFIADERKLNTDVFIPLEALNGAKHDDRVIARILDWKTGSKNPVGEVVEVMSDQQSSDMDMKMILIGNGFSIDFPRDVYGELDQYTDHISEEEIKNRVDYREVLTVTIDPEDAKDFDDAISIRKLENGNHEVGVHIADVSHYVREGTALDKEAEKRATSVYLPDRVCPMLP